MFGRHPQYELIPYLRGELDHAARERVANHLHECAACAAQLDAAARALQLLARQLQDLPTPEWTAYRRELRVKLAERQAQSRPWWRLGAVWGSLATAGIAAALLVALNLNHRAPLETPPVEQLALADANVDLLRNYPVVERMDMLENYDVIEHLDELQGAAPPAAQVHQS
ncbi:MAG TPA: zf-HC2 domain-containing protein [Candidatus Binataceae bacterium]|nr:zf-HC2 domain-containing protein [Candidatus Binataceae bacterium]